MKKPIVAWFDNAHILLSFQLSQFILSMAMTMHNHTNWIKSHFEDSKWILMDFLQELAKYFIFFSKIWPDFGYVTWNSEKSHVRMLKCHEILKSQFKTIKIYLFVKEWKEDVS